MPNKNNDVMITRNGEEIPLPPENPIDEGIIVPDTAEN